MTIGVVVGTGGSDEAGGVVDDGGGERVGFGTVDHAQIDRWQTPTIDLGVAGHCCERSEQSLTKGERPGQTNTN